MFLACAVALLAACAGPALPRGERLAALEQRAAAQRARSERIERELGRIETAALPDPPGNAPLPYYELSVLKTESPIDERYEPGLRAQLAQALSQSGASALEYRGVDPPKTFVPPWADQQFPGLSPAVLFAAANAAAPQFRGAEFDVRVALRPGPDRCVTAIHELDGRVRALDALASAALQPAEGPSAEELQAHYRIGAVTGWSAAERASLDRALGLLRPAERARLAGVPFRRESGHGKLLALGHARARHCGNFSLDQEQRWVEVYDCAFDADRYAFVGPLDQPLAPSVRIVLHEIAHALSGAQLGDLLVDVATSQREAQQMVDEFNQLGAHVPRDEVPRVQQLQDGIQKLQGDLGRWQQKLEKADQGGTPVVRAFLRLPGASSGFTSYGRTNAAEAFAEAFSLCRTDPEAGRRISAQVCAFFESDAYLEPAS